MGNLIFRKIIDLGDIPSSWSLVRLAADWNGYPILLFVEDKPARPDHATISADPWTFTHWYRTPPKAHHVIHFDGSAVRTICFERSQGISTFHAQPLGRGWLLADRREGCANLHDASGQFLRSIDLGDASEDIQTTPEGKIWVSYFDEGVFGNGIGGQGVVCFDADGNSLFKYGEFAERVGLPFIADCYAMNVAASGDVWLNYYTDFPLVHLHEFALERVWTDFGVLGKGFALRDEAVIYARKTELMLKSLLPAAEESEILHAQDESGESLVPSPTPHLGIACRGSNLLLNTGLAVYLSV